MRTYIRVIHKFDTTINETVITTLIEQNGLAKVLSLNHHPKGGLAIQVEIDKNSLSLLLNELHKNGFLPCF